MQVLLYFGFWWSGSDLMAMVGKHGCKRRRVGRKNHWTYRKRRAGNGNTVEQQGVDGGSMNLRITGLEQQRKGNARYELRRLVGSRVVKVVCILNSSGGGTLC